MPINCMDLAVHGYDALLPSQEIVQAIVDEMGEHYDVPRVPKAHLGLIQGRPQRWHLQVGDGTWPSVFFPCGEVVVLYIVPNAC